MLAFRSLDPFRALREPDRRRRDEERLSRSEQRTLSKTQNNHLTGKAPYKFESGLLQRGVRREPDLYRREGVSSEDDPHAMGRAVLCQRDSYLISGQRLAVELRTGDPTTDPM